MNIEEEDLSYNEKFKRVEDDVQEWKDLVVIEDVSTSPESREMIKEKVLNTSPKMATWGDMHEDLRIEEVTPMSKVEEYII